MNAENNKRIAEEFGLDVCVTCALSCEPNLSCTKATCGHFLDFACDPVAFVALWKAMEVHGITVGVVSYRGQSSASLIRPAREGRKKIAVGSGQVTDPMAALADAVLQYVQQREATK